MTTNKFSHIFGFTLMVVVFVGLLCADFYGPKDAQASAPSGLAATVATTSNPTVNTTAALIFATSTNNTCAARSITTSASAVMLTFSQAQGKIPTGSFGILQPASTTVAYDSGQYGCAAVYAYSFTSQVITVQESR